MLRYICYLPGGRSVLGKTVPEVLSMARGRRPRAILKTEGTFFLNTDRPRPVNNVFIFFPGINWFINRFFCVVESDYVPSTNGRSQFCKS